MTTDSFPPDASSALLTQRRTDQQQWLFQYLTPEVPEGRVEEMSFAEAEKYLLEKLEAARENPAEAMWNLAHFYKRTGRPAAAFRHFKTLFGLVDNTDAAANIYLSLGQTAETGGDFELAVRFYSQGIALAPVYRFTRYYLHNNIGYSYNQLGQYEEGEQHCRRAIEINPDRHNAYKNVGIALANRGQPREAAESFVKAVQANASDPRALVHLRDLLEEHPELLTEFADTYARCYSAVRTAMAARDRIEVEMQRKIAESRASDDGAGKISG